MPIPPLTRPPFAWLRDVIAIDTVASQPVAIRTRRIRGRLRHEHLDLSPGALPLPALPVVTCLGNHESVVRRLHAPFSQATKAHRVFPALLDLRLPFPETECRHEFIDVMPSEQGGIQTLAVAARRTTITRHLDTCRAAGYDPLALDQETVALWTQSLLEIPPAPETGDDPVQLVIGLYDDRASLGIGRQNHLLATGNLGGDIIADLRRRLAAMEVAVSPADAVEVRWTGPGAGQTERLSGLIETFNQSQAAIHHVHDEPQWMLARALATRTLRPGPDRCNLRQGADTHPDLLRRHRRRSLLSAAILGLSGIVLLILAGYWQRQLDHQDRALRQAVVKQAEAILGQSTPLRGQDAVDQARRHVNDLMEQTQPLGERLETTLSIRLESIIRLADDHGILIHRLQLDANRLHVQGSTLDWDSAIAFRDALQPRLPPLVLQRQWDAETDDDRIYFDLSTDGEDH